MIYSEILSAIREAQKDIEKSLLIDTVKEKYEFELRERILRLDQAINIIKANAELWKTKVYYE